MICEHLLSKISGDESNEITFVDIIYLKKKITIYIRIRNISHIN